MGVLSGFTARSYYISHQISKVPLQVKIEDFKKQILYKISNEEHKKYIENHYSKGENYYILKENITVEDKSKIYDIFTSADLDVIEAIDGCGESAGY